MADPLRVMNPMRRAVAITPSDSVELVVPTHAIMVNGAGDVSVVPVGQDTAVTLTLSASVMYPLRVKKVNATSTTATGITGFWNDR